ncbi:MAG: hypothetical protein ACI9VR_004240 [Cognaticolwellia sp.]
MPGSGVREIVKHGIRVSEDVVDQHGVFTDGVVDLGGQNPGVRGGIRVDVTPLLPHLGGVGRLAEPGARRRGDPLARDADLAAEAGVFGEERWQCGSGDGHRSPPGRLKWGVHWEHGA